MFSSLCFHLGAICGDDDCIVLIDFIVCHISGEFLVVLTVPVQSSMVEVGPSVSWFKRPLFPFGLDIVSRILCFPAPLDGI